MRAQVERRWREEKYHVLYYSQKHYLAIRQALKDTQITITQLEQMIIEAKNQALTIGNMRNAYEHMWGYFKKKATHSEKMHFHQLLKELTVEDDSELNRYTYELAKKYEVTYLLHSTLLKVE